MEKTVDLERDHLHTRGEYRVSRASGHTQGGSPPHTWRIHVIAVYQSDQNRITSKHVEITIDKLKSD